MFSVSFSFFTDSKNDFKYKTFEGRSQQLTEILGEKGILALAVPIKDHVFSCVASTGDDKPIGFIVGYEQKPNEMYVNHILVLKDFQQKGIATQLLRNFENVAKEKGFNKLSLIVADTNTIAKRMYDNMGFVSGPRFMVKLINK